MAMQIMICMAIGVLYYSLSKIDIENQSQKHFYYLSKIQAFILAIPMFANIGIMPSHR